MHLAPSPQQQALKDAVRRFCDAQITPARLGAWDKEAGGIDAACWSAVAELGWLGLGLPVSVGGSGLGLVEIACVLEECARGLIPRRVINAIRGALVLAQLAPESSHLPALARGERTVTLACDEQHVRDAAAYATHVVVEGRTPLLSGEKLYVPDGTHADLQIVAAREGAGVSLVLVPAAATRVSALRSFDGERQAIVRYDRAPLERLSEAGQGMAPLVRMQRQQTALALAEMVGGMDGALAMTVAYVKEREQFGNKIGVFQAVQHQVAEMAMAFTASRHLAWQAITRLAAETEEGSELATAAAFAGQAFKRLTLTAHHLHGGAGYVVEHPLHYHAERAQSLCIRYAPEARALAEVAATLLDC